MNWNDAIKKNKSIFLNAHKVQCSAIDEIEQFFLLFYWIVNVASKSLFLVNMTFIYIRKAVIIEHTAGN